MGEIAENCPGVKLVLVALKCDLREKHGEEDGDRGGPESEPTHEKKQFIDYQQGLDTARRIQALRYLGEPSYPESSSHACASGVFWDAART